MKITEEESVDWSIVSFAICSFIIILITLGVALGVLAGIISLEFF